MIGKSGRYDILDQIDVQNSEVGWFDLGDGRSVMHNMPDDPRGFKFHRRGPKAKLVFLKAKIEGLHMWKASGPFYILDGTKHDQPFGWFVSKEFLDALGPVSGLEIEQKHSVA